MNTEITKLKQMSRNGQQQPTISSERSSGNWARAGDVKEGRSIISQPIVIETIELDHSDEEDESTFSTPPPNDSHQTAASEPTKPPIIQSPTTKCHLQMPRTPSGSLNQPVHNQKKPLAPPTSEARNPLDQSVRPKEVIESKAIPSLSRPLGFTRTIELVATLPSLDMESGVEKMSASPNSGLPQPDMIPSQSSPTSGAEVGCFRKDSIHTKTVSCKKLILKIEKHQEQQQQQQQQQSDTMCDAGVAAKNCSDAMADAFRPATLASETKQFSHTKNLANNKDGSLSSNLDIASSSQKTTTGNDSSHVTTNAAMSSRAREELSTTPPLPAPSSSLQHSGVEDRVIIESPHGNLAFKSNTDPDLPKKNPSTYASLVKYATNPNDTRSMATTFSNGIKMKSRPKRKGPSFRGSQSPPSSTSANDNNQPNSSGCNVHIRASDTLDSTKTMQTRIIGAAVESTTHTSISAQVVPASSSTKESAISSQISSTATKTAKYHLKPFCWDSYLKIAPAEVAPKEAFNQPLEFPKNNFELGMKLEVRDPRNSFVWGLATVISKEGLYLRLRFDNTDNSNDVYELIDSDKIRCIGSSGKQLLPPVGFKGNIANYSKFVEKVLSEPTSMIAPPECFPPYPMGPTRNLFKVGMKLEAVDIKNRDLVCPATISHVNGTMVRVTFDGWKGSFDYECEFRSRILFPINWCRDTGKWIQPPNGWDGLLKAASSPEQPIPSLIPHLEKKVESPLSRGSIKKRIMSAKSKLLSEGSGKKNRIVYLKDHKPISKKTPSSKQKDPRGRKTKDPNSYYHRVVKSDESSKRGRPSTSNLSLLKKDQKISLTGSHKLSSITSPHGENQSASTSPIRSPISSASSLYDQIPDNGTEHYSCQRTVTYHEWRERKRLFLESQQHARESSSTCDGTNDSSAPITESKIQRLDQKNDLDEPMSIETASRPNGPADASSESRAKKIKTSISSDAERDHIVDLILSKPAKIVDWSAQDIGDLISTDASLVKYSTTFIENEIDGKAIVLMTQDVLMNFVESKIGPFLKIKFLIDKVKTLK